jgi:glutamyl-tRNA synthetase
VLDEVTAARISALMPGLKERAKSLVELADSAAFLAQSVPLAFDAKATALLTDEAKSVLRDIAGALAETDFSQAAVDAALREYAERTGKKLGQVAQPLRAALTGSTVSPGIDATLAALGRDEALARIGAAAGKP